jgi:hypothetical protein
VITCIEIIKFFYNSQFITVDSELYLIRHTRSWVIALESGWKLYLSCGQKHLLRNNMLLGL